MKDARPVEIICAACGAETLLLRKPKYEGFTRVGDSLTCTACGHEYASEDEVPFKQRREIRVFTDADRVVAPEVFHEDEKGRLCLHCVSYIVNPFTQWCGLHRKEVESTDSCDRFAPKPPPENAPL
ncbi:MAG: hypothetical protein V1929_02525 [bacterium]